MDKRSDVSEIRTRECQHRTAEPLGNDRGMTFLRCLTCRAVIVSQGGRSLAVPPVRKGN